MNVTITTLGALIGLALAIVLIILKVAPAYSMMAGALIGGLIGGASIFETVELMITGASGMSSTILRIITAGVLAGVLIESGAAKTIANSIVSTFGEKRALFSLALSTGVLTAVGVFGDVAVITVAPIALAIGNSVGYSNAALLIALMGGEKAGMVISPNPQAITIADGLDLDLITLMYANIVPAIVGVIITVLVSNWATKKYKSETVIETEENKEGSEELPTLWASMSGPIVVILLLVLRPLTGIEIDPLIALPAGGLIGVLLMGKVKSLNLYITSGLTKMMPIAVLLIGTGTLSGIIGNSQFQMDVTNLLTTLNIPAVLLAPISTTLLAGATASASAGVAIAIPTFADAVTAAVSPLAGGAMMHAGSIVLDHLPHGSIFHASAGVVNMSVKERLKLIPYEILIGLVITITSVLIFSIIG